MALTAKQMIELMKTAKELGLHTFKAEGLEFSTVPQTVVQEVKPKVSEPVPDLKAEDIVKELSPLDGMSEDEILYFATPYYEELQAKKEAQMNRTED